MGGRAPYRSKRAAKRRIRAMMHAQGLGPRDPARQKAVDPPEDSSYIPDIESESGDTM